MIILLLFVYLIGSLFYAAFAESPKILNSIILALPINNNVYPILLQGLIIAASMVFGFYGIFLFYASKRLSKVVDKYLADMKFIFKISLFIYILLPSFFLILSIFFSLNGLTYYGIAITFTTEQISTGHIPIAISNSSIENSTYFNLAKNYSATAQGYYEKLLYNTKRSISMIFLSAGLITAILTAYLIDVFGGFEYVNKLMYLINKKLKPKSGDGAIPPPPPSSPV